MTIIARIYDVTCADEPNVRHQSVEVVSAEQPYSGCPCPKCKAWVYLPDGDAGHKVSILDLDETRMFVRTRTLSTGRLEETHRLLIRSVTESHNVDLIAEVATSWDSDHRDGPLYVTGWERLFTASIRDRAMSHLWFGEKHYPGYLSLTNDNTDPEEPGSVSALCSVIEWAHTVAAELMRIPTPGSTP